MSESQGAYRALFTADVHLSNQLPHSRVEAAGVSVTDRLRDLRAFFARMGEYAHHHKIDHVWILGDFFDRRLLDAVTLKYGQLALRELTSRGCRVHIQGGNHDAYDAAGSHHTVDALAATSPIAKDGAVVVYDRATLAQELAYVEGASYGGLRFCVLPFTQEERAKGVVEEANAAADPSRDVLLIHQTVKGAFTKGWKAPGGLRPSMFDRFRVVLAGHFHTQQVFENGMYLGAPIQHHFADSGELRGFNDITFVKGARKGLAAIKVKLIEDEEMSRFHTLVFEQDRWVIGEIAGTKSSHRIQPGDYVRLVAKGERSVIDKASESAQKVRDQLLAHGVRAAQFRPILSPKMKRRVEVATEEAGAFNWERALVGYVEESGVDAQEQKALLALGRLMLEGGAK